MSQQKKFFSILLLILLILGIISFGYKDQTALFPLIVIGFGLLLVALKILTLIRPELAPLLDPQGFFESSKQKHAIKEDNTEHKDPSIAKKNENLFKNEVYIIGWGIFFVALIYVLGFFIASAIATFVFIRILGKRDMIGATTISLILPLILYLLFDKLLKIQLYAGFFFGV